jgi:phosphoenolpyruvate-protein phosphotransferase/dihydroxyacetone kinase phosphotransfer subunit
MVGIVLVAHSRALAEALVALVRQVASPQVPLAIAAGAGPDREEFGTDAVEIAAAIRSVYSAEGVVVLMDLGSAVLSAEMALEFLPQEILGRIVLCPGPLVEGAIAAGVQAGLGSDLQAVCQEASRALMPKSEQLGGSREVWLDESRPTTTGESGQISEAQLIEVSLPNYHGLHARPAARFVQLAGSFDAQIEVLNLTTGKGPASALSLNALATLGAQRGHRIAIRARGPQASSALEALGRLVESGFGETGAGMEAFPALDVSPAPGLGKGEPLQGIPVSEGIACGPAHFYRAPVLPVSQLATEDPVGEQRRLAAALEAVQLAITARQERLRAQLSPDQVSIFDAHRLILQDPDLLARTNTRIEDERLNAAAAWQMSIAEVARAYQELDDPYLQARRGDVLDVGDQVLRVLLGVEMGAPIQLTAPAIVFAEELSPGETASLEPELVLGLVTASGGPTSHSAILARALGLPALTGVDLARLGVVEGTNIALDGANGLVWIEPSSEVVQEISRQRQAWLSRRLVLLESNLAPACTLDGRVIEVAANAGSLATVRAAVLNGAQGIGVLRTEFLYLDRDAPPTEDEQVAVLQEIGRILGGLPAIVRTLDVGGDKALRYIPMLREANPYLGVRGLRLSLRQPELFLTQLRAILLAGVDCPLQVLLPMVTGLDEVLQARALLEQAHHSLETEGRRHRWPVGMGIMIEVPAAALISLRLAPHVDFFSIGTNDLTQYTLAAERGNPVLASLADALHPAVLRLVRQVVDAAHQHGRWAGVCGEIAGDPRAVPLLVGMGIDELSLNPADIPAVKQAIREVDFVKAGDLVEKALACENAAQVRALVS